MPMDALKELMYFSGMFRFSIFWNLPACQGGRGVVRRVDGVRAAACACACACACGAACATVRGVYAYRVLAVLAELLARDCLDQLEQQYAVFQLGSEVVHLEADLGELQVHPRGEGLELHPLRRLRAEQQGRVMVALTLIVFPGPHEWRPGSGDNAPPDSNRLCRLRAHRPFAP